MDFGEGTRSSVVLEVILGLVARDELFHAADDLQKVHHDTILPQERHRIGAWKETWDWQKTRARLAWVDAIRIVLASALALCGINAPMRMEMGSKEEDS